MQKPVERRAEIEKLLAMARADRDPVGIEYFKRQLLRIDNPDGAVKLAAQRRARDRAAWPFDDE